MTAQKKGPLAGRRVLVVGGSSGIGRGFALAAARYGAGLVVTGRHEGRLTEVGSLVGARTVQGDVADADDCARMVQAAVDELGALDAIFYTPAPGYQLLLRDATRADWDEQLRAILLGAADVTKAALPHLAPQAVLLFLSSVITSHVQWGMGGYAASKAALEKMIEAWQLEHPEHRFSAIAVGPTSGVGSREQHQRDPDLGREISRRFVGSGFLHAKQMDAEDLGAFIADLTGSLLAHPDIAAPFFTVRPAAARLYHFDVEGS